MVNSKCVFSTSAVAAALLSVLTAPSCSAFLTPRSLTPSSCSSSRKQSHHYFLPRSGKWQLHQSTVNGEAPAAADASDSDAATSDNDDEATTSEPEFNLVSEDVPPSSYEITSSPTAPGGGSVHNLTIYLGCITQKEEGCP